MSTSRPKRAAAQRARYRRDLSPSPSPTPWPSPAKKRRKKARQNSAAGRGKAPGLGLLELPLDIMFEILSYLAPLDILNLARTAKPLRVVLMHSSALPVWKRARENVDGLPECPQDMAEPCYANLAFYPHCHFCLTAYAPTIYWAARVRCCKDCIPENFRHYTTFASYNLPVGIVPPLSKSDFNRKRPMMSPYLYSVRTVQGLAEEMRQLHGTAAINEWTRQKRCEYDARIQHARQCEVWHAEWCRERSDEKYRLRSERADEVIDRLAASGWGEEIAKLDDIDDLRCHKLVWQPKKLTERTWRKIKPTLVHMLSGHKADRLHSERVVTISQRCLLLADLLREYTVNHPFDEALPNLADLALTEPFKAFIEDLPLEEELTLAHFGDTLVDVAAAVDGWRREKEHQLVDLVRRSIPETSSSSSAATSLLHLATTFFNLQHGGVNWSENAVRHSYVLAHRCRGVCPVGCSEEWKGAFSALNRWPLDCRAGVRCEARAWVVARRVLVECGRDPERETFEDVMDFEFECEACVGKSAERCLVKWPVLINHVLTRHRGILVSPIASIVRLGERERRIVAVCRAIKQCPSETGFEFFSFELRDVWQCVHCREEVVSFQLRFHLTSYHPDVYDLLQMQSGADGSTGAHYHDVFKHYAIPPEREDAWRYPSVRLVARDAKAGEDRGVDAARCFMAAFRDALHDDATERDETLIERLVGLVDDEKAWVWCEGDREEREARVRSEVFSSVDRADGETFELGAELWPISGSRSN